MSGRICQRTLDNGQRCGGVLLTCKVCKGRYCPHHGDAAWHGQGICNSNPRRW